MESDEPRVSAENRGEIEAFESRIDSLHLDLRLLRYSKNLAIWSFVTNGLERLYQQKQQNPEQDRTTQSFLSRSFGLFLRRVQGCQFHGHTAIRNLRLDPHLKEAATEANSYARFWFAANGYFPEWHQKECNASIAGPNSIRFSLMSTTQEQQVSAYQKSFRPQAMRIPSESVYAPIPQWIQTEYLRALSRGTTKDGRFLYEMPQRVYEYYRDWYAVKMRGAVEHASNTDLGAYDIGDATCFWSALAAHSSVHDYLCYAAGQRYRVPLNSILLIKKRDVWALELSQLSGLSAPQCKAILDSIICQPHSAVDLHITPFLSLDSDQKWLALATPLAISSRYDQNLLRICSANDPERFNRITPDKERKMRGEITEETSLLRIRSFGPFSLPRPLPDIDLVLEDLDDDTIVIAEMKWVRPPVGWKSRRRATGELMKGLEQLRQVREFLAAHPEYLKRYPHGISKPISEFRHVYYSLIARGHLLRIHPEPNQSIIPFDAVKFALKSERHLAKAMAWLLGDCWLPQEGIDFKVQNGHFTHKGYTIEAPIFTPA